MISRSCRLAVTAGLLAFSVGSLSAQSGNPPPATIALMNRIDSVFLDHARNELGLNADQSGRMEQVATRWSQRRLALDVENRQLHQNLNNQLRPGIAAKPVRVAQLVDLINTNRVQYAQSYLDEMRDLGPVLTPVQRGQFQLLRERLQQQVRNAQLARPLPDNPAANRAGRSGGTPPLRPGKLRR